MESAGGSLRFLQDSDPRHPLPGPPHLFLCAYSVPTTLVTRYFGSDFEKLYQGQVAYRHRKLKAQLRQTKNLSSRSVLLVISPRQRHGELVALLRAGAVRQKMEKDFFLSCYVAGNSELQGI